MKFKTKLFLPLVLVFSLFVSSSCFAKNLVPSFQELLNKVLIEYCGIVLPPSTFQDFEEWYHQNVSPSASGRGFDDYLSDNISIGDDGDSVITPELQNNYYHFALDYIDAHPTSYSIQKVYSYTNASSTFFANATQYNSFRNFVSSLDADYIFMPYLYSFNIGANWKYTYNGSTVSCNDKEIIIIYCDKNLQFYGSGHHNDFIALNDLFPSYEWTSKKINDFSNETTFNKSFWSIAFIRSDGTVVNNPSTVLFRTSGPENFRYYRNAYLTENQGNTSVFNTTDRTIQVYLYDSLAAISLHDTGQPSPFYTTSNYVGSGFIANGDAIVSNSSAINNSNIYEQITQSITTGLSADDVINIINTIVNDNNDKPLPDDGGDSVGDDDEKDSIWDKIGKGIAKLIGGIGDFLLGLVDGLVEKLDELIDKLTSIFNHLTSLVPDTVSLIFTSLFGWLPEEIISIITGFFALCCIFGIIRLIRG